MKFIIKLVLILVLSALLQMVLPFWIVAVVAFLVSLLLSERPRKWQFSRKKNGPSFSFLAGFLAIFILWAGMAYGFDLANNALLSNRISDLLFAGNGIELPAFLGSHSVVLLTGLFGGIWAGFAGMAGNVLGELLKG